MSGARDNSAEAQRARAEAAFAKQQAREQQVSDREREEAERIAALDEKTARLKALRLAKEAQDAAAKKPKSR